MKIIFATNNQNKRKEIQNLLGKEFQLLSLKDIGFEGEIPEDYPTLEQNALQKAQYIYDRFQLPCFADDTGLEVEELNGEPGVYSARYAGEDCVATNNIEKLLTNLSGKSNRKAQFKTVVAYIDEKGKTHAFDGKVEGDIARKKQGEEGFGYDPVFIPYKLSEENNVKQLSFAQISLSEKNKISHRGIAIRKLVAFLNR